MLTPFPPMKAIGLSLFLAVIPPGMAKAQKPGTGKRDTAAIVYDDVTSGSKAVDREAKKAYAGIFHIVEITETDGFVPSRLKGEPLAFHDPRSMREWAIPGKMTFVYVVSPEGKVIAPRALETTDKRVSDEFLKSLLYRRFVPPSFKGTAVFGLSGGEITFGGYVAPVEKLYRDGLGLQGYHDR
jgi:hypothetical protein